LPAQAGELSQSVHRFDARAMGAHQVPGKSKGTVNTS
jgi:hypothetical protein